MSKVNALLQGTLDWVDARFPLTANWKAHLSEYYAPKNFNFWYFFGSLAILVLVLQIVTGIFLTMHFKPDASLNASGVPVAFASVEYIMRDVSWGWLIRYMHSTGASAFFIVVYLHMFRGLIYGSYRKPRELIWLFGIGIFLCLMGEAFFGYLLPWGQMSFWGAQVIVNLFSAIPVIGPDLSIWLRGDYVVGDATLNRFFAFHVIAMPLVLVGLVAAHIIALHEVGSNNPDGVEIKKKKDANGVPLDGIPFHPYYTVKDIVGVIVFLMVFSVIVWPHGARGQEVTSRVCRVSQVGVGPDVTDPHTWYQSGVGIRGFRRAGVGAAGGAGGPRARLLRGSQRSRPAPSPSPRRRRRPAWTRTRWCTGRSRHRRAGTALRCRRRGTASPRHRGGRLGRR